MFNVNIIKYALKEGLKSEGLKQNIRTMYIVDLYTYHRRFATVAA